MKVPAVNDLITNDSATLEEGARKMGHLKELRREVRAGLAQLEAGDVVVYSSPRAVADDVKARGRATLTSQSSQTATSPL